MALKTAFKEMTLGAIYKSLAPFATSPEVEKRLKDVLNIHIVTLGQGGGRKGAELARFGWDLWMVNSASVDMAEHDWIEKKVFLSDPDRGKLEGTAKNASIGHAIAQKNIPKFKQIAIETQDSDLVMVTVALGGGTGNGAIPTALEWLHKARKLADKMTEKGNPTIMVIASIPSRDEANPDIWKNALSGLKALQDLIDEKKIGSVILVDNEFVRNYYERQDPMVHQGKKLSALDYSNVLVARTFFEIMIIPLLSGQVSMDSSELLEILTTPGWLTINRKILNTSLGTKLNLEHDIEQLFQSNEVFSSIDIQDSLAGGIALLTNKSVSLPPSIVDQVKPITNKVLGRPSVLHSAIIQSNTVSDTAFLIGLAVSPKAPEAILTSLLDKYNEEKKRKGEKEQVARNKSSILAGFSDDVYTTTKTASVGKKKVTLEDLEQQDSRPTKKRITAEDL